MIWGAPGIGKSSIVSRVAEESGRQLIDLRLSQLAPTDLRGLPVAKNGVSRWFPPEFLPNEGKGILFLDEINMAPPAMQGMAQQLILDRQVGNYVLPKDWLIWSAGNRKEDRASVYDMPAPLSNRFLHLNIEPELDSFKVYSLTNNVSDRIISFLSFRPELLHKIDNNQPAWPSPRTWIMADQLYKIGLDISISVGSGPASEFYAFEKLYKSLPDLNLILNGRGEKIKFSKDPGTKYAIVIGLIGRQKNNKEALNAMKWLIKKATPEWVQLFVVDLFKVMREKSTFIEFQKLLMKDPDMKKFLVEFRKIMIT